MNIEVVSIPVTDQDAAKAFYEKLGFVVAADIPMDDARRWVQMTLPGDGASISLVTWFEGMKPGSMDGLVIQTKNFDETHALIAGRGLEISEPDRQPWGVFSHLTDPDGNGLLLKGD